MLLWLAGCALRLTILAVPPVIPLIHDELHMSATQIGILTGLPSMLFAAAAVPGSLLIARLGVRPALIVGLAVTALAGALRGALPDVGWLYAMTIAMGAGVAIMQVTMPPAVRAWVPDRIGFATAVYTNGLLIGEILARRADAAAGAAADRRQLAMGLRGLERAGRADRWHDPAAGAAASRRRHAAAPRRRWWPDWSSRLIWRLGIMLGTVNATYFATNAFLPDYLRSNGQGEWISAALSGAQHRATAGVVHPARRRRPPRAQGLALCHLRRALPGRHRRHRVRQRRRGLSPPRRCKALPPPPS